MPVSWSCEVRPGIRFEVMGGFLRIGPCVVIPAMCMDQLTDEEIGAAARRLSTEALFAQALEDADHLVGNAEGNKHNEWLLKPEYQEMETLLRKFAGRDRLIDHALVFFQKAKERQIALEAQAQQYKHPTHPPKVLIRRELRANYDKVFVKLGKRDGFHCYQCKGTKDLVIDHIVAIANGGTNAIDNLRLLCTPCNGTKSDKE